jgi:hypothetical protein
MTGSPVKACKTLDLFIIQLGEGNQPAQGGVLPAVFCSAFSTGLIIKNLFS